jgi:hypothetical protein
MSISDISPLCLQIHFCINKFNIIEISSVSLEQQDVCQLCGSQEEDVYHALLVCPHAVALRQAMRAHWSLPLEGDLFKSGPDWLLMMVLNSSLEVLANLFMLFFGTPGASGTRCCMRVRPLL